MSNSEGYTKSTQRHPKTAQRITINALKILRGVNEPSPDVKKMAEIIICDFRDIVGTDKVISFADAVSKACDQSAPHGDKTPSEAYLLGKSLASEVLRKAATIEEDKSRTVGKMIIAINRNNPRYKPQSPMRERGRTPKPSIPIDASRDSAGRHHSPKPPYKRARPSKTHRRKAA